MFRKALPLAFAAAAATLALAGPAAADPGDHARQEGRPVQITFDKSLVSAQANHLVFAGTTGGAAAGTLTTDCYVTSVSGSLDGLACTWTIDAGRRSFVVPMTGTFDTARGTVDMTGRVSSGWLAGHDVWESGQLVDRSTYEFRGVINVERANDDH